MTSRGCIPARTDACGRSIRRPATSAWCRGRIPKTNRNAYETIHRDTLFTNVALTADNQPWWEGLSTGKPVIDWQGRPYDPARGSGCAPRIHGSRSPRSGILPTRRVRKTRRVCRSARSSSAAAAAKLRRSFMRRATGSTGCSLGASVASETTAAMVGQQGVVRRDPMAMLPFCGYNFADYWQHWLNIGAKLARPPRIYHVNWFRT